MFHRGPIAAMKLIFRVKFRDRHRATVVYLSYLSIIYLHSDEGRTVTPVPQVRAGAYLPFVEFMERLGAPYERDLERELIPAVIHRNPEALVPVHLAHSFLARSARCAGITSLGYIVGHGVRIEDLGAFGRSLVRSLTLHDALGKLRSQFPFYGSAEQIWWAFLGPNIQFLHRQVHETGPGGRDAQQCALLLMRDVVRLAAGRDWQPGEVLVTADHDVRGTPVLEGNNLSYIVKLVDGEMPEKGAEVSVFIDVIGMPLTPVSYAGVARRTYMRAVLY